MAFSESPAMLGLPSVHTDHWDPFWKVCADLDVVVCVHLGSSSRPPMTSLDAPADVQSTLLPLTTLFAAADLV